MDIGRTLTFTPSDKPMARYEGKDILENVDSNHLEKLRATEEMTGLTIV